MQIQFKETCFNVSEFTINLLQSYIDVSLKDDCNQYDHYQSIESTQLKCLKCEKNET
jgi:hypothetical protein